MVSLEPVLRLPFYHTGARGTLKPTDEWAVALGVVNGWNTVVDNNPEKSGYLQLNYASNAVAWSLLYFGGIERPDDIPEGDPWRSTFDTHVTWTATDWLKIQPHLDAGFEPTTFGTSFWVAVRLEYRHDHAAGDMFFAGDVAGDGDTAPFTPDARSQNTLTLGGTAWF